LIGHLVELISGEEFDYYCQKNIYGPLNMSDTSFFLRNIDEERVATCHQYLIKDTHIPLPHYGIPD